LPKVRNLWHDSCSEIFTFARHIIQLVSDVLDLIENTRRHTGVGCDGKVVLFYSYFSIFFFFTISYSLFRPRSPSPIVSFTTVYKSRMRTPLFRVFHFFSAPSGRSRHYRARALLTQVSFCFTFRGKKK